MLEILKGGVQEGSRVNQEVKSSKEGKKNANGQSSNEPRDAGS